MKLKDNLKSLLAFSTLILNVGNVSFAQGTLWTGPTGGTMFTPSSSFPSTWGEQIQVGNSSVSVTALGVFDYGDDGLAASHPVGLWNAGGFLLGSVTVQSGTSATLIGDYRYKNLTTPITLSANTIYYLGVSYGANNSDPNVHSGTATLNPAFYSSSGTYYGGFPVLAFPSAGASWPVQAASLEITTVPEPGSLALIGLGIAGLTMRWSQHRLSLSVRFRGLRL
jgi:hypothetical protein